MLNESVAVMNSNSVVMNSTSAVMNSTSAVTLLNPVSFWIVAILLLGTLNFTLMLPSGLWAAWLMIRSSRATLESECFSLHLLCTDMTCALIVLCATFNFYFLSNPVVLRTFSLTFCMLSLHSQPVFQCSVCLERYVAVVHPVTYLKYKPLRYKAAGLGVFWFVAVLLSLSSRLTSNLFPLMGILLSILFVETFCSLSILAVLKRSGPGDVHESKDGEKERSSGVKKRAFIIVTLLQVKLLVNYSPLIIISSIESLISKQLMGDLITLAITFCFFGSFFQPLMYLYRAGKLPCTRGNK
ncbi:uncharacterized protein LOC124381219 [Silurus meridionalis]|uniref:uncharacterized protein LOC124381219 n=1 Tax=Silurus meridionalis TaxID=175797 RepID=UPI001EECCB7F|nr:uncharacterized protein LOC124381219 [Silurus meridionalis]